MAAQTNGKAALAAFSKLPRWGQIALALAAAVVLLALLRALLNGALSSLLVTVGGLSIVAAPFALLVYLGGKENRAKKNAAAPGYSVPMEWRNYFVRHLASDGAPIGKTYKSFTTARLLKERSAMPPFNLWYYSDDYMPDDNKAPERAQWLSVLDGNPRLGSPTSAQKHYVQRPYKFPGRPVELSLYEVKPEVALALNLGPLRKATVKAIAHPSGDAADLRLPLGSPGGKFPSEPTPTGRDTKGSGRKADLSDWEEG